MYEDLADFSIKYLEKKGASYVETRLEDITSNGIVMKNGVLEVSGFDRIKGIGTRFILNGALGFVTLNNLNKNKMKELMDRAVKKLKYKSNLNEPIMLAPDKAKVDKYVAKEKIKLANIGQKEKIEFLFDIERSLANTKVNLPSRYFELSESTITEYLVNSEGTRITATIPKISFLYFLTILENAKSTQRYWNYGGSGGWEIAKGWNLPNILSDEMIAMRRNLKEGIKSPKGKFDVVVGPQVTGIMVHESVGHPYEADRIFGREAAQAGESFVTPEMLGYQIGSDIVNVVDDSTLPSSYGFLLYDNEGVKTRRKYLIKEGKINEFLHNRETAAYMNIESNGSSRAVDYDKESIVRMSNTFMLPGDYSENELIEGIKQGVYIKNFMEWNIDDKRLNQKYVGAEAYLIRNGRLAQPIRNPIIEVSSLNLYKAIDALGNNSEYHAGSCGKGEPMQGIPVSMGGPSIRLRNLLLK